MAQAAEKTEPRKTYLVKLTRAARYHYKGTVIHKNDVIEVGARERNHLVVSTDGKPRYFTDVTNDYHNPADELVEEEPDPEEAAILAEVSDDAPPEGEGVKRVSQTAPAKAQEGSKAESGGAGAGKAKTASQGSQGGRKPRSSGRGSDLANEGKVRKDAAAAGEQMTESAESVDTSEVQDDQPRRGGVKFVQKGQPEENKGGQGGDEVSV